MKKGAAVWLKAGDRVRYAGWEYKVTAVYADPLRFDLEPAPGDAYKKSIVPSVSYQHIDAKVATKMPADLLARGVDYQDTYAPPALEARLKLDDVYADNARLKALLDASEIALAEATEANRRLQDKLTSLRSSVAGVQNILGRALAGD